MSDGVEYESRETRPRQAVTEETDSRLYNSIDNYGKESSLVIPFRAITMPVNLLQIDVGGRAWSEELKSLNCVLPRLLLSTED